MQTMGNQFDNMCLENILLQGIEESHYILEKKGMYEDSKTVFSRAKGTVSSSGLTGAQNQNSYAILPWDWPLLHLCALQKHTCFNYWCLGERLWWAKLWSAFTLGPIRCGHRTQAAWLNYLLRMSCEARALWKENAWK